MKSRNLLLSLLFFSLMPQWKLHGQDTLTTPHKIKKIFTDDDGGMVSFGARTDINIFTDAPKSPGIGTGGSMRLQLLNRLNTEWFGDYVTSNLYNKAHRVDAHIGWNVMFYILDPNGFKRKFTPFVAAGQCFDYTSVQLDGENQQLHSKATAAVQMELGCHYNITPRFDVSLSTLYDLHLGDDLDTNLNPDGSVTVTNEKGAGWEGHIMIIFSAHYKIGRLWNVKRKQV
jgi:hypothetical protein